MNSKCRIVPPYAASVFRLVKIRHLIVNFGIVAEGLKAVSKPFWYVHRSAILSGQFHGHPLLERRRRRSQVHDHVVDSAGRAANQLCFCVRRGLIVHAAQGAFFLVKRNIALDKASSHSAALEFLFAKGPRKEPTIIGRHLQIDNESSGKFTGCKDHDASTEVGSHDAELRNRHDEMAAASAIVSLLLENFLGKIPSQE